MTLTAPAGGTTGTSGRTSTASTAGAGGADGDPDLLARIDAAQPTLSRAELAVARAVLADPAAAAQLSITDLAGLAGVSEASITRFCRSMGLRGYAHLRLSLAAEAAQNDGRERFSRLTPDISREDPLPDVIAKIAAADARAVRETARGLDPVVLGAVAGRLSAARRVEVFGVGASALVAGALQHKLHHVGIAAIATVDVHWALMNAARLDERDVVVVISHSGRAREAVEVAAQARRRDATVVAVTSDPDSPLAREAGHLLATVSNETVLRTGGLSSRVPELTVVDCVWVAVALGRYDETVRSLGLAADAVRGHVLADGASPAPGVAADGVGRAPDGGPVSNVDGAPDRRIAG